MNISFYCLWFDPTGNQTRVDSFSSRCSIHSTTDRLGTSNQIFRYTQYITPKRATSWQGPSPCHCTQANTASLEEMSQRLQAVGKPVSDLTGLGFEPQTSHSKDQRVIAWPTGQLVVNLKRKIKSFT